MAIPKLEGYKTPPGLPTALPSVFGSLACDVSLREEPCVSEAIKYLADGDVVQFLELTDSWTKQQYGSASEHRRWNQLACFLKKYPFSSKDLDPEAAALKKFRAAEHRCRRVNARFTARARLVNRGAPGEYWIHSARRWIQRVIGATPNYGAIWKACDFGPGASNQIHGTLTHSAAKLEGAWTVTPGCLPLATAALSANPLVWEYLLRDTPPDDVRKKDGIYCHDQFLFRDQVRARAILVHANKIICVPKTAKVHRTIAIEPTLNGYVQTGIDTYIRRKLRRVGIDLSTQAFNQHFAKLGSEECSNPFATIDLASASDSVTIELCRCLLPPDWFDLLMAARSPCYELQGVTTRYHKIASMGNGFCFPLETLIFASIVHSVYEETGDLAFLVYGDDIIVRQGAALLVIERLKYAGFSVNTDKTFVFGPFKESCGADYFRGENVRPYYADEVPRNWGDVFKWLNGLRRIYGEGRAWSQLLSAIPSRWRLLRPFDGPDDAITVEHDRFIGSRSAKWHPTEQRWSYRKLCVTPISDRTRYAASSQMYGLLRGTASRRGHVDFTHRRKTMTQVRLV